MDRFATRIRLFFSSKNHWKQVNNKAVFLVLWCEWTMATHFSTNVQVFCQTLYEGAHKCVRNLRLRSVMRSGTAAANRGHVCGVCGADDRCNNKILGYKFAESRARMLEVSPLTCTNTFNLIDLIYIIIAVYIILIFRDLSICQQYSCIEIAIDAIFLVQCILQSVR